MSIVMFLGRDVKEYESLSDEIIDRCISTGKIRCELCARPVGRHSKYVRGKKESGERLTIVMVWCKKCKHGHALLPDFILPHKHYSGNEVESVIIDSATTPAAEIATDASASTVRRWISQIGERIMRAISILKYLYMQLMCRAISEMAIEPGFGYAELEQLLGTAPKAERHSGNKLGLANIWLGCHGRRVYI